MSRGLHGAAAVTERRGAVSSVRERIRSAAPVVLVGIVPALLLGVGVARFVLNHFYAHAPVLLDAGLLSKIVYRDGLTLAVPPIAVDYARSFYDVHISPLSSLFSALSYITPLDRIHWYALVEGLLYVPLAFAAYLAASPAARLPFRMLAVLAFAFSGMVVWTIDFPHFEIATAGLTCAMLAAFVVGRRRTAWVCLLLAAAVKQDAGIHLAMALLPLWFVRRRGVELPVSTRELAVAIAVAVGTTILGMVCQRLFFHPVSRLTQAYVGSPAYAHVSWALIAARLCYLLGHTQTLYAPLLATALLAAIRRDPRYLLGWLAAVPWFVFNLLAVEDSKAAFVAYGIAPFLVAMFWVYLYGAHLAPAARRLRAGVLEVVFAAVCLTSTWGMGKDYLGTLRAMALSQYKDAAPIDTFVDILHTRRAAFGRIRVDYSVAALAIEWFELADRWVADGPMDAIAFHRRTYERDGIMPDILRQHVDACTHVVATELMVCARTRIPASVFDGLQIEELPGFAAFALPRSRTGLRVEPDRLTLSEGHPFHAPIGLLPAGRHTLTVHVAAGVAHVTVDREGVVVTSGVVGNALTLDAPGDDMTFGYTVSPGSESSVTITGVELDAPSKL